jgi:ferritin-like metal-binding protein YciE
MGLFSKSIKTMDDLFVHALQDVYYAENQIVKALPKMIETASGPQLKHAFQTHLGDTQNHVKRVEEVFRLYGQEPKGTSCPAIDGIIKEANEIIGDVDDKEVCDAAVLAAAQAVDHYEITRYDCANMLHKNLEEEKTTDDKLSKLAEANINRKAAA